MPRTLFCAFFSLFILLNARAAVTFERVNGLIRGPIHPDRGILHRHTDGNFYGSAPGGGAYGLGQIFRVTPGGAVSSLIHFTGTSGAAPGALPFAGLVGDGAGLLWGVTQRGGADNLGTIFKFDPATGTLTSVASFTGATGAVPGSFPSGELASDGAGSFWGTTENGGAGNLGTLFKVHMATNVVTTVVSFTGTGGAAPGSAPVARLISDGAGNFWGTTRSGGASDIGTVFKVAIASGVLTPVVEFTGMAGAAPGGVPSAGLASDGAGSFWGTTQVGGVGNLGTVFKVAASTSEFGLVTEFTGTAGAAKGSFPVAGLLLDGAGFFWGVTQTGGTPDLGTVFKIAASNGAFSTVQEFTGIFGAVPGANPMAEFISDGAGDFHSTTQNGGTANQGVVFRVTTATGALTTVADFETGIPGVNGRMSFAGLVSDGAGSLWGTTSAGGAREMGTVYKMNLSSGEITIVQDFTGVSGPVKGTEPRAGLVSDGAGNLWGSTVTGGTADHGTIFKVNINTGALMTMVEFTGVSGPVPGSRPIGVLVFDGAGSFWGTTLQGGAGNLGTVFKVAASTGALTTVQAFTGVAGDAPGALPFADLVSDGAGFFWGATTQGGATNLGTLFKVNATSGALTSVVNFTGLAGAAPGSSPIGGLLLDGASFYGTTANGGASNVGTVFKVDIANGALTSLVAFTGVAGTHPGALPFAGLTKVSAGSFLGTTLQGGSASIGTVYQVSSSGAFTSALAFTGVDGTVTGSGPGHGRLLLHTDDHFYGTTLSGGRTATGAPAGGGQIYRLRVTGDTFTPLQQWKLTHLGDANAPDTGDPDSDGVQTLDEYGLLRLPHIPDAGGAFVPQLFTYPEGRRLRVFFPRDPEHNDVTVLIEAAFNLTGPWTVIASSVLGGVTSGPGYVGGDNAGPGVKTIEVRDVVNIADAPQRFLRFKVIH